VYSRDTGRGNSREGGFLTGRAVALGGREPYQGGRQVMPETCPISTERWTRRVHFVREGGGGGRQVMPARRRRGAARALVLCRMLYTHAHSVQIRTRPKTATVHELSPLLPFDLRLLALHQFSPFGHWRPALVSIQGPSVVGVWEGLVLSLAGGARGVMSNRVPAPFCVQTGTRGS